MGGGRGERSLSQLLVILPTGVSGSTNSCSGGRGDVRLLALLRQLVLISSGLRGTTPVDSGDLTSPSCSSSPSNTLMVPCFKFPL